MSHSKRHFSSKSKWKGFITMECKLTVQDIIGVFGEVSLLMDENKDYLCELDGAIGDGDIGLTMSRGFQSIKEYADSEEFGDIGSLLLQSGMTLADSAPSTMGTLFASGFIKAGKVAKGKTELYLEDLRDVLKEIEVGIMDRGKAKVGDKTILDALSPATISLEQSITNNEKMNEAIEKAYHAAVKGMNDTANMQSQHGRAGRYLEKSIGKIDPGATVGALFYKGIYEYISK